MRTDQTKTLAVVRHVVFVQSGKGVKNVLLAHDFGIIADIIGRTGLGQSADNQFVGFASEGISTGIGNDAAFINAQFQFVERIDPVAGIVVLQFAFNRRMVQTHNRHQSVARLLRSNALADLLKDGRRTLNTVFVADGIAKLGTILLVAQVHFGLKLFDKRFAYLCRHFVFSP